MTKKNPKADLERKRFAFFQIGLVLTGALCLAAFEYSTPVFSNIEQINNQEEPINFLSLLPEEVIYTAPNKKTNPIIEIYNEVNPSDMDVNNEKGEVNDYIPISTFDSPDKGDNLEGFEAKDYPIINPSKMPEFPGGYAAMSQWISKHLNIPNYVHTASGNIYISFIVDKSGKITNASIAKGIDPVYDKAALDVIKKMPRWTPGEQFGKPVSVKYDLPIKIVTR